MAKVLVLFYSTFGHIATLAEAIAEGATQVSGVTVDLRRVPETLSDEVLQKMDALDSYYYMCKKYKAIQPEELLQYDAIICGAPTRYGRVCSQMVKFWEDIERHESIMEQSRRATRLPIEKFEGADEAPAPTTIRLSRYSYNTMVDGWNSSLLCGKLGSTFVSTASQHGGNETTAHAMHAMMLHQGMVLVGLPYTFGGQTQTDEVAGCSPYGSSTISGGMPRSMSKIEEAGAKFQGRHVAAMAQKLVEKRQLHREKQQTHVDAHRTQGALAH